MSCGVGCRRGSDLVWLWLWRRPAALAPIRPLAWEPPYAEGVALKKEKKRKENSVGTRVSGLATVGSCPKALPVLLISHQHLTLFLLTCWPHSLDGCSPCGRELAAPAERAACSQSLYFSPKEGFQLDPSLVPGEWGAVIGQPAS